MSGRVLVAGEGSAGAAPGRSLESSPGFKAESIGTSAIFQEGKPAEQRSFGLGVLFWFGV